MVSKSRFLYKTAAKKKGLSVRALFFFVLFSYNLLILCNNVYAEDCGGHDVSQSETLASEMRSTGESAEQSAQSETRAENHVDKKNMDWSQSGQVVTEAEDAEDAGDTSSATLSDAAPEKESSSQSQTIPEKKDEPATALPHIFPLETIQTIWPREGSQGEPILSSNPSVKAPETTPLSPPATRPEPVESTSTLFSATSFWNTSLSNNQTTSVNSDALVAELIANTHLAAPWVNTTSYSTPLYTVDANTPLVPVSIVQDGNELSWTVLNQRLQQGVPIPIEALASEGTDGHLTIWDKANDRLYEFWQMKQVDGRWQASWGGILDNVSQSNGIMPTVKNAQGGAEQWGATATGLPMIGGTMLLSELESGRIPHALAIAIIRPLAYTYLWPAQRTDGFDSNLNRIAEGQRFRFNENIEIDPSWSPLIKMMVEAVRDYGLVVRDKAGAVVFYGEDPSVYGLSAAAYEPFMGGLPMWEVMKQFPWEKLVALQ